MLTPWGNSDSEKTYRRGFHWVSTPSHGGFLVGKAAATQLLTPAAIAAGEQWGGYIAFEEDCDAAVVFFEREEVWDDFLNINREDLFQSLSYWKPQYLLDRGIEPDAERVKARQKFEARYLKHTGRAF